ncbi:MAG: response regulator [Bacteriovoracia bacterium]
MTNCTVLLVEDDRDLQEVASELLLEEGFDLRLATTGQEVLTLLKGGFRPGCILLDLGLPDMSAADFLERYTAIPGASELPIVLVSGNSDIGDWAKRFKTRRIIRKPYGLESLVDSVTEFCGQPKALTSSPAPL